jgi:phosphate transport system protein
MKREHTDRRYEGELRSLREQLLLMGAKVEEMIASSIRALTDRDSDLAHRTIESDHQINRLEVDTDDLCLRILARRQPVASDLRIITIVMKMVTDLERIGDLGVNICERVIELNTEPPLKPYVDLPQMAEVAQGMMREALDAFVSRDPERAQQVIDRDRMVDAYYAQIFRELLTYMMEDPRNIFRATRVQSIAKYLERIGDHATNLAEMVIFMVKGKDIRHLGRMESGDGRRVPHGVLFVCEKNSARSQMAEGWARKLLPSGVRIWSAGLQPADTLNPYAVRVMREVGVEIANQRPKPIAAVPLGDVDTMVTLGRHNSSIMVDEFDHREAWDVPDPVQPQLGEQEAIASFRRVRDEIRKHVEALTAATVRTPATPAA